MDDFAGRCWRDVIPAEVIEPTKRQVS